MMHRAAAEQPRPEAAPPAAPESVEAASTELSRPTKAAENAAPKAPASVELILETPESVAVQAQPPEENVAEAPEADKMPPASRDQTPHPPAGEAPYLGVKETVPATCDDFLAANPSTGTLRIQAYLGQQALPIPGAAVRVFKICGDGEKLFYSEETNSDGIIDGLILPAPSREESLVPGTESPYATYTIIATHPDYYPAEFDEVPVFSGVKSIQNISFLPRPTAQK